MRVSVIGGGAIGLLLTSYMIESGLDVKLYTRTDLQARTINEEGLLLHKMNKTFHYNVIAKSIREEIEESDLIIVTVKQYDLNPILSKLIALQTNPTLMFIQNGMGHIPMVEKLPLRFSVILSVIEHGAIRHSNKELEHTGIGKMKISSYRNSESKINDFKNHLDSENFPVEIESDWYQMVCHKLVANALINPLTSIYRIKNGQLLKPHFFINMKELFEEVSKILNLDLDNKDQIFQNVIKICESTKENYSSMLKDIENKRTTEIESILGYLIKVSEEKNIDVPLIRFLFNSIKGLESYGGE